MATLGSISAEERDKALKHLPKFPEVESESAYGGQRGHMLTLVRKELNRLGYTDDQIDGGGLKVTTTLTEDGMRAAQEGVLEAKPEGFGDKQLHAASASVEVGTGRLLGFYAGQDYLDSQINWAVSGGMVGSTMKPFTLAAAIDAGFSLRDTFAGNSPFVFPDGLEVRNAGGGDGQDFGERVNAILAMQKSINTAFVDMSSAIPQGPSKIQKLAMELGVPPMESDQRYPGIPSTSRDFTSDDTLITLGRARVSPINMANAYATIANGGRRADVHVIEKVELADGSTDYEFDEPTERAMDEDIAADVSFSLQETVSNGSGATVLPLGRPAAGKTGTATNSKDDVSSAWFVGYTPQISTAVMYVRGDGDDRLAAVVLRVRLPRRHLALDHAADDGRPARRGLPGPGLRRRRRPQERLRADDRAAVPDEEAVPDQERGADRGAQRGALRGAHADRGAHHRGSLRGTALPVGEQ